MSVTQERRKFVRIPANLKVSYKAVSNHKACQALTKDISEGGLRFIVDEFIPKKTILDIDLALKDSDLFIETSTRVKWIKTIGQGDKYEIGVEFINISEKSMKYLIDYISSSLKSKKEGMK